MMSVLRLPGVTAVGVTLIGISHQFHNVAARFLSLHKPGRNHGLDPNITVAPFVDRATTTWEQFCPFEESIPGSCSLSFDPIKCVSALDLRAWGVEFHGNEIGFQNFPEQAVFAFWPHTSKADSFLKNLIGDLIAKGTGIDCTTGVITKPNVYIPRFLFQNKIEQFKVSPDVEDKEMRVDNLAIRRLREAQSQKERYYVAISPEGTLSRAEHIQVGYSLIAKSDKFEKPVPVIFVTLDFDNRKFILSDAYYSRNENKELILEPEQMTALGAKFYEETRAHRLSVNPTQAGPFFLKPRGKKHTTSTIVAL